VIVNKKFWDGLPADIRKQLEDAMEQSTVTPTRSPRSRTTSALECVKKSGKTTVYVPTKEERLAFKKALVPVHQKMEGRIGKEMIQAVYKDIGFKPDSL
jgi:C4-dicarboxylate-binding protein DctP